MIISLQGLREKEFFKVVAKNKCVWGKSKLGFSWIQSN